MCAWSITTGAHAPAGQVQSLVTCAAGGHGVLTLTALEISKPLRGGAYLKWIVLYIYISCYVCMAWMFFAHCQYQLIRSSVMAMCLYQCGIP